MMKTLSMAMLLTPFVLFAGTQPSAAQSNAPDAPPTTAATSLDKVEVTASKRTQLVLDVPYAVTVISDKEIADRGVIDIKQLQSSIPTLFITENAPGASRIQLRGLSQGLGYGQSLVGEYLDEISLNMSDAQRSLDVPLVDMQRIEVLRGPQGTLYGDGSLGGVIRFITKNPELDTTSFTTEVGGNALSHGNSGYHVNGVLNAPLVVGTAALRLVVGHDDFPGWIDNSVTGAKDINGARRDYVRGKLYYKISDTVDATLMAFHTRTETANQSFSNSDFRYAAYVSTPTTDDTGLGNLVVKADFGAVRLVSSTGYLNRSIDTTADLTGAYRAGLPPAFLALLLPRPTSGGAYRQQINMKIATQELRLESLSDGPFNWTAGTYYRRTNSNSVTSDVFTDSTARFQGGFNGDGPTDVKQVAFFGEATYAFTRGLSLTAGLRHFRESSGFEGSKLQPFYVPPSTPPTLYDQHATFEKTTPRVNLLWRYSDQASAYSTVSQGFRSGGFNSSLQQPSYGPETITTYEVGNKAVMLDNRLQYEVAAYYSKYKDVQAQDLPPGCNAATCLATTVNSGKASGPGFDVSFSALLARQLTLDGAFGYSHLTYDDNTRERSIGDPLNFIPKKTASLSLTYRFAWGAGLPGMARVDLQHADATKFINRSTNTNVMTNPINYVNARVGIERPTWQLYVEGKNLNDFRGITNAGFSGLPDVRSQPRSVGIVLRNQI